MLLEFCIENFLSLKERAKLSLVASTLKESLPEENDLISEPEIGLPILRSAVIFGANASSKSNVLKALSFCKHFITDFLSSFSKSTITSVSDVFGWNMIDYDGIFNFSKTEFF